MTQYTLVSDFLKQWPAIPWLMGAVVLGLLIHFLLFKIGGILARRTESGLDDAFLTHCRAPMRFILPLLFCNFVFPMTTLSPGLLLFLKQIVGFMLTGALAWLIIKVIYVFEDFVLTGNKRDARQFPPGALTHLSLIAAIVAFKDMENAK